MNLNSRVEVGVVCRNFSGVWAAFGGCWLEISLVDHDLRISCAYYGPYLDLWAIDCYTLLQKHFFVPFDFVSGDDFLN